jgi:hypothetical protein
VNFFGIQLFSYGRVFGDVCEKYSNQLAFALDGTPVGKDFINQEFGRIGMRFVIINRREFRYFEEFAAAFSAKLFIYGDVGLALGAFTFKLSAAFLTKLYPLTVIRPAIWTFHFSFPCNGLLNKDERVFHAKISKP